MKPSRAMIPGEILCAAYGVAMAYFGGLHHGWLHRTLVERGESVAWLLLLGIPAAALLVVAVREWTAPSIGLVRREKFAKWRGKLVGVQGLCWLYAVYFGITQGSSFIGTLGVIGFLFCTWSYWENRRSGREIRHSSGVLHG